jgi:hypothetical protein
MDKKVINELNEMKYLFGYERGRVISEQKEVPVKEDMMDTDVVGVVDNVDYDEDGDSFDLEMTGREVQTPVRPDVDTPTTPTTPSTPYKPKPGVKTKPKAGTDDVMDVDMPNWLSFDELGLNFED